VVGVESKAFMGGRWWVASFVGGGESLNISLNFCWDD